jgi:hypothetical protein
MAVGKAIYLLYDVMISTPPLSEYRLNYKKL